MCYEIYTVTIGISFYFFPDDSWTLSVALWRSLSRAMEFEWASGGKEKHQTPLPAFSQRTCMGELEPVEDMRENPDKTWETYILTLSSQEKRNRQFINHKELSWLVMQQKLTIRVILLEIIHVCARFYIQYKYRSNSCMWKIIHVCVHFYIYVCIYTTKI